MTAHFRGEAKTLAHPWVDPDILRDPARVPDPWPQLVRVAHTTLRREGPVYRLQEDHERPGREILRWRCLSLALPPALWCAAAHPTNVGPDPPTRIRLLGRMLAPASPVAHLHLHLSAAHAFGLVWSALAAWGVPAAVDANPSPLGKGPELQQEWRQLLNRALLVRRMLATAIDCGLDLDDIIEQPRQIERRLARRRALADLRQGEATSTARGLESAIAREAFAPAGTKPPAPTRAADVWAADPLADGLPDPEVRFLARAFAARLSPEARGALVQYVRVYCMLYRHLVQPLDAPGFPQFREKFGNGVTYTAHLRGVMPEPRDDAPYLRIKAVEARVGPTVSTIEEWCARLRERGREASPAFSLVIHFLRRQKRKQKDEPLKGSIARLHREAQSLAGWMTQNSDALTLVRGFDLAGDEIGGPLWTALPALVHMRAEADRIAALSGHPSPGLTLHVGEVGRTWLSQLRAVDAPFARRLLRRGDRLGHGMILGRDPAEARSLGGAQPLWERIVDLEWLLEWLSCPALAHFDSLRAPFIAERSDLLAEWSSADAPPMGSIWRGLGDPSRMLYLAENPQHESGARPADRFISAIIDRDPRRPSRVWQERVFAAPPVALLEALRRQLLRKIADWQIPIEVNPSSNLVIGALNAPFDQPLFQLRATGPAAFEVVPVVLSTDDPLQFSTCLEDEYAYAFAGMTAADGQRRPASYARHWLEDAAQMSLRARF